jgi:hypothetical protein
VLFRSGADIERLQFEDALANIVGRPGFVGIDAQVGFFAAAGANDPQTLDVVLAGNTHLYFELMKTIDAVFPNCPAQLHAFG